MLATTPSGSCVIRSSSFWPAFAWTFSSRSALAEASRKKSRRARRPLSSFRDCRIGLPTSCVSVRASVSRIATIRSRNAAIAASRARSGVRAHFGCAERASSYLRRTAAALSAVTSVMTVPSAGLTIFMACLERERRRLVLRRGREEFVENRRVVDERRIVRGVEFGMPLHGEHVARAGEADRLGDAIGFRPRFDDQVAAQVLDRLVVDRVGLDCRDARVEPREPRAGDERRRVAVFLVDRPVPVVERARHLRAQVLPQGSALRDVDDLRAAADAEHRLALRHEGAQERDLVVVADPVAVPLGLQRLFAVGLGADVGAAHQHEAVELAGVRVDRRPAARAPRAAFGRGDHEREDVALHEPVRDVLLDVLERHPLEDRALPVLVEEARRDADLEHQRAAANSASKSARVQGRGFVLWQVSLIATSTSAGTSSFVTGRFAASAPSVAGMPSSAFIRESQSTNADAAAASAIEPAPATPATRASSAIFAGAADALKRITWSIMMPFASPWCRSATVDSACAQLWTAPRSFWNAIAPIIELISMSLRACRSWPSRTASGSARAAMRTPSSAIPSQSGWYSGDRYDSTLCVSASMPVAAVTDAGRSSVSSGSANTHFARSFGEKTIFFTCVVSSDTTLERPTSEPVPAVVGSATKYGRSRSMGRTCGWSHAYSRMSPGWVARSATALATSRAAPPPRPITASAPWFR